MAEATASKSVQCRFESDPGHARAAASSSLLPPPLPATLFELLARGSERRWASELGSAAVAKWLVERRLSRVGSRLKSLRAELRVLDEQLLYLDADAEEQEIRALVSETSGATAEAREARQHADVLRKQRLRVAEEILELERRQDELLDELSSAAR